MILTCPKSLAARLENERDVALARGVPVASVHGDVGGEVVEHLEDHVLRGHVHRVRGVGGAHREVDRRLPVVGVDAQAANTPSLEFLQNPSQALHRGHGGENGGAQARSRGP